MGTGIYTPIRASRCSATRASASCARQQSRVHAPTFAHALLTLHLKLLLTLLTLHLTLHLTLLLTLLLTSSLVLSI